MRNKRNIFLFIMIWTVANSSPTHFKYISKPNYNSNSDAQYLSWSLGYPNLSPDTFYPDLSSSHLEPLPSSNKNKFPNSYPSYPSYNIFPFHIHNPYTSPNFHSPEFEEESQETQESSHPEPDVLVQSLNSALNKLNQLLPQKQSSEENSSIEECSEEIFIQKPTTIRPEVLAESLNKAIDSLSQVLGKAPVKKPSSASDNLVVSSTLNTEKPSVNLQQVSVSIIEAVEVLKKLFESLPDEFKTKNPTVTSESNSPNPNFVSGNDQKVSFLMGTQVVLPTLEPVANSAPMNNPVNIATDSPLFTSRLQVFKSKVTENSDPTTVLFTSLPSVFTSSPLDKNKTGLLFTSQTNQFENLSSTTPLTIRVESADDRSSQSTEENMLFTSSPRQSEKTSQQSVTATSAPEETDGMMLFTSSPRQPQTTPKTPQLATVTTISPKDEVENISIVQRISQKESSSTNLLIAANSEIKTNEKTSEFPLLDIRFGTANPSEDKIIFPDEFEKVQTLSNLGESVALPSRFGGVDSTSTPQPSKRPVIGLLHFPSRPNIPDPNPSSVNASSSNQFTVDGIHLSAETLEQETTVPISTSSEVPIAVEESNLGAGNNETSPLNKPGNSDDMINVPNRQTFESDPSVFPMPVIPVNLKQPNKTNATSGHVVKPKPIQTPVRLEFQSINPPGVELPTSSMDKNDASTVAATTKIPQTTTPINLEYKPSKPPFAPDPWPPLHATFAPDDQALDALASELLSASSTETDRNKAPSTFPPQRSTFNSNNPIILEYKPNRPSFQPEPLVYPMPVIRPESNQFPMIPDRNGVPSTTEAIITRPTSQNQNTPIILGYKPSRPPVAPNPIVYPMPIIRPESNPYPMVPDRNGVPSTTDAIITRPTTQNQNTPIILGYKPSRPPVAPNPIVYPMPIISYPYPAAIDNNNQVGDRNQVPSTSTTWNPTRRTTQKPYTSQTPISLEYKPFKPSFLPVPWVYPSPGLIPPGTPWPASSTERPFTK